MAAQTNAAVPVAPQAAEEAAPPSRSLWRDALEQLLGNRLAAGGAAIVIILALLALAAPALAPDDPTKQHYDLILAGPSAAYPLGNDALGRDVVSRLMWGARISLSVGIFTQLIVLAIGLTIGATAGIRGGQTDNLLMRLTDVVYAFPDLLLVILFRSVFGPGIFMIFLAIALAHWVGVARLVRGQILSLKQQSFIEAARALGATDLRLVLRHLLPNAVGPLVVYTTFNIPRAIFTEAALSFIGIGTPPPTPSWGSMIQEGTQAIFSAPTLVLFPGLAIAVTMMAFTFVGDGLRDALDPRMRRV